MNAHDTATRALDDLVTDQVKTSIKMLIDEGTHRWEFDPEVEGVVGLIYIGTNRADVVVYLDGPHGPDFELNEQVVFE